MEHESPQPDTRNYDRIAKQCVCANIRRASRAITNLYDEFLQPSGLLATQFILLSALTTRSSMALTPLADQLGMDPTTLARNFKPLERDGLIEILTGIDRRTRIVKLTTHGKTAYLKAIPLWEKAQGWVIDRIGKDRWRVMLGDWTDLVATTHQ